jgi:membrane protein implicated in regulation of membrane protease activity
MQSYETQRQTVFSFPACVGGRAGFYFGQQSISGEIMIIDQQSSEHGITIIYAVCLVAGLIFTLLSAVVGHLFGGHGDAHVGMEGQADGGVGHDGVPGISFLSPTVLASFVTAFGAFGLIFSKVDATSSVWLSAPLSFFGGLAVALLVLWLFNAMFKRTEGSSESRVAMLIGQTAAIVTPIPENGVGEISYTQAGSRYTAPARAEKGGTITSGKTVKITRIVGTQFYVEQLL